MAAVAQVEEAPVRGRPRSHVHRRLKPRVRLQKLSLEQTFQHKAGKINGAVRPCVQAASTQIVGVVEPPLRYRAELRRPQPKLGEDVGQRRSSPDQITTRSPA